VIKPGYRLAMAEETTPPETDETTGAGTGVAVNDAAAETAEPSEHRTVPKQTNAGRLWIAIGVAVVLLVLLIIFIAENSHHVTISFLGASGTISSGLAMLISAVAGSVVTLLVGTARILQLRREVRRNRRHRA
jgi:uncharacterized integral membrane protein